MPVFRVEKNRDYTTMSNVHLRDKALSLKAKGLLSQILSLPDEWNYSVSGLAAINKESRDSIRTAIVELEECGYIVRHRQRTENGKLGDMEYVVYEKPINKEPDEIPISGEPTLEKPTLENPTQANPTQANPTQANPTQANPTQVNPTQANPTLEKPTLENPAQLNTDTSNKDLSSTDLSSKDGMKAAEPSGLGEDVKRIYGEYRNVRLSNADMENLKRRFPTDYGSRIERLSEYMESSGKSYRNHYLTICQWARHDAEQGKVPIGRRRFENYECEEGESY